MENISPELNYSPVVNNHSSLVYRVVSPQAGGDVTTNVSASVGPTEFLIPPSCWIPEMSRLNFQLNLAAVTSAYNYVNANTLTGISRITLYDTATSNIIMDCSNFEKYASLVSTAATKFDDFVTKNILATVGSADASSQPYPVEDIQKTIVASGNDDGDNEDLATLNPYFARRQFFIGAVSTATVIDVSIPFTAFKLSALSSDKIWYSPSSLVLQVYWNANNNYAFSATSNTDPTTGTANLASAITIKSPQLILANEGNLAIVSQVINKVMSGGGIQLPIAYPTVTKTTISQTTSHAYQLQLTRGYGNRILAMLTAAFDKTSGANYANVHDRVPTTFYNTFLNNVAIRFPAGFKCTTGGQDWTIANFPYFKGSALQNIQEYVFGEWVHVDGFFGNKPLHEVDQHQVDGLDVTAQSSTWQLQATTSNVAYDWLTLIVGQKSMSLTAQGVMVQ